MNKTTFAIYATLIIIAILLILRLYTVQSAVNDVAIVLIEQLWMLREYSSLKRQYEDIGMITWPDHALCIPGRKGELIIRRYLLLCEWVKYYQGNVTSALDIIRKRIDEIDDTLITFHINMKHITISTIRMVERLYQGDDGSAKNITRYIVQKIRQL